MPLKSLRHPDNPWVWCGESLSACEACDHKCEPIEQVRFAWAYGVKGDDEDHYHHDPRTISVTETLNCPRKSVLMRLVDYAESPRALAARAHGTAIHKAYEACNKDGCSEVRLSRPLSHGYTLGGQSDRIAGNEVKDYKSMDSFRKTLDVQHEDQLSIYADMAGIADPQLVLVQVTRKGVQEMAATYNPEAYNTCVARAESMIAVLEGEADVSALPPVGRDIKHFRSRHCDYCPYEVRRRCEEISPPDG